MLEDEDIARILRERLGDPPDPEGLESAAQALVAAANEAGGHDNITAALVVVG
jgi:serine/threonine protein phosphatase PrpC